MYGSFSESLVGIRLIDDVLFYTLGCLHDYWFDSFEWAVASGSQHADSSSLQRHRTGNVE